MLQLSTSSEFDTKLPVASVTVTPITGPVAPGGYSFANRNEVSVPLLYLTTSSTVQRQVRRSTAMRSHSALGFRSPLEYRTHQQSVEEVAHMS